MNNFDDLHNFYGGKNVFITGHTGFKGSWLVSILQRLGANVTGYSLKPVDGELFDLISAKIKINSIVGDVRDLDSLKKSLNDSCADIVFHMAAQPLVRYSYENPVYTYETNLMGTVNILEAIRLNEKVRSVVNVTTDKVYQNTEQNKAFKEDNILDGHDPYSNSKSCSELITACYRRSLFTRQNIAISTVRAGNVIGGGDFAKDRIIPDCVRFSIDKKKIVVRNPNSIRPFQHVLEPLFAYLILGMRQYNDKNLASEYNIGPNEDDCITIGSLVNHFCNYWGLGQSWTYEEDNNLIEAGFLKLDNRKIKQKVQIEPKWNIEKAVLKTVEWYKIYQKNMDIYSSMLNQIDEYIK